MVPKSDGRNRGVWGIADSGANPQDGPMAKSSAERRVVVLAYDGVQSLDAIGPMEVFDVANRYGVSPQYAVELVGPSAAPIVTSSGITITPGRGIDDSRQPVDTL